jgi:PKD repeat protein
MKAEFYIKKIRRCLILLPAIFFPVFSFAQSDVHPKCGSDIEHLIASDPEFRMAFEAFEQNWETYKQNVDPEGFERSANGKYIIPVVVHVLHIGGNENISATQVKSQITALNTLFGMQSPGLSGLNSFPAFDTLVPYFNGHDTCYSSGTGSQLLNRFEFRLATKDPEGNCTDGIVRVYTEKADFAQDETYFKQKSYWDRSHYFNIWVIRTYPDPSLLGYAQFPFAFGGHFPLTSTDGIAIKNTVFGTTGTASGQTGATPTHEAGHWLGLFHIWGDADCGSDGIDDTPIHFGPDFCDYSATNPALNAGWIHCPPYVPYTAECYTDTNSTDSALNANNLQSRNDVGRMWMNFMDYTDDQFQWMFTEQQYRKMNVTMETIPFRGSLNDPTNITNTGTDDQSQTMLCHAKPVADLWSRDGTNNFIIKKMICAGGDLTYADGTYNLSNPGSDPHTRAWSFESGAPATSTISSPVIVYNTPGTYDAQLISTNADGTSTKTWDDYVIVSPPTADESNIVYYDDFEYSTSLYEQGKWINLDQGVAANARWEQATNTGYMSSKCMVMRNENNVIYEQDFLISASYDMTTITNDRLYFKYAGARKTNNPFIVQNDRLQVYISTNCGESWSSPNITVDGVNKTYLSGDTLYSAGLYTGSFVPTNANQWKTASVNLSAYTSASNLRVMFVWTSGGEWGNDFYIDQVNITNSTSIGIDENSGQTDYSVYPNPVSGTSQIYFKLPHDANVSVDVLDLAGRVVKIIYSGDLNAGEQYYQLNNADFNSAGIYLVRLTVDDVVSTKKVIIE